MAEFTTDVPIEIDGFRHEFAKRFIQGLCCDIPSNLSKHDREIFINGMLRVLYSFSSNSLPPAYQRSVSIENLQRMINVAIKDLKEM